MTVVDADAHVIECERTWSYVESAQRPLMPRLVTEANADGSPKSYWVIEGRAFGQANVGVSTTSKESRELSDVGARLQHMDQLEIDVQVLFPSLFLRPLTADAQVEIALAQSFNRWLGDIWSQGAGRLRWAAVLPMRSMEIAISELREARDHGACAAFTCGIVNGMTLNNPYFSHLYETLSDLEMPLCIHAGNNSFEWEDLLRQDSGYSRAKLPVMSAFHSLVSGRIPQMYPRLRIGFIEAASQWLPGTIHDMARRSERRAGQPFDRSSVLRDNRLYVTCQTDDDLPYVLKYAGEDNLVIGTDYGHNDTATEIEALRYLKTEGQVGAKTLDKILGENAQALYGL